MCGIFAILGSHDTETHLHEKAAAAASRLSHRGPDWSGLYIFQEEVELDDDYDDVVTSAIAHERLQIVDPYGGEQPIFDAQKKRVLAVNGEIYNHKSLLESDLLKKYKSSLTTRSDCEVIIPLWKLFGDGAQVNKSLAGVFAYILWDSARKTFLIARDAIGVNPLYIGYRKTDGALFITSEIKALASDAHNDLGVTDFVEFPPGHYMVHSLNRSGLMTCEDGPAFRKWLNIHLSPWYTPGWKKYEENFMKVASQQALLGQIRDGLTRAVERRLMSDVPFGFLLSGGLDSSLVCSIAARLLKDLAREDSHRYNPIINTYSIGQIGSPDLEAAQKVADYLGSNHHGFTFTVSQGIAAIPNVIYHVETFDITTVRASTPMYLLSRRVKALGTKMVMSGEGADELFGGYLYFHKAPSEREFYEETVDKVCALSKYDCRRANKSTAAWGVEVRVPFLDREFVDFVMSIPPAWKMVDHNVSAEELQVARSDDEHRGPMEKWILRKAFEGYLPDEILWRQKEQFSDGVGYSWIDGVRKKAEAIVSDTDLEMASSMFPEKTPLTKEALYYRQIFAKRFPHPSAAGIVPWSKSIACSTERALCWQEGWADMDEPSGRAVGVHVAKY